LTLVMPNEQKLPVNDPQRSVTSNKSHMPASMFVAILKNYLVFIVFRCIDKIIIVAGYAQHIKSSTQSSCWPARTTFDGFTTIGRSTKTDWRS
jgi:hypothetical protein